MVAVQIIPGVDGKLRQHQGAVEPEPRVAENGQEHRAVTAREIQVADRLGEWVLADHQIGRRRRGKRDPVTGQQADDGHQQGSAGHQFDAEGFVGHQQGAADFAEQDADEGAHLDDAVAADQFIGFQVLRQIGVFDGAEQGRVHAHADHRRHQQPQGVAEPADTGDDHDGDFQPFDGARQVGLFVFVGDLAGSGGKHHVRKNEQGRDDDVEGGRGDRRPAEGVEGEHHQQRRLEQVVVERAEKLGPEKRRETALAEQRKLAGVRWRGRCGRRGGCTDGTGRADGHGGRSGLVRLVKYSTLRAGTNNVSVHHCVASNDAPGVTPRYFAGKA